MAVEAHHINLFPPQILTNREIVQAYNLYKNGGQMAFSVLPSTVPPESLVPSYQSAAILDPIASGKTSMNKAGGSLSYHHNMAPRKRSRDPVAEFNTLPVPRRNKFSSDSSFLDQAILHQIHSHQSQIDGFIVQHTEKMRMVLEEHRKRQLKMVLSETQDAIMKKLKEKDQEIQKMEKLSWMLQERVKTLCVENQVWKELAQTNEATANSLRTDLEQVLAHVSDDRHVGGSAVVADIVAYDVKSSCKSNNDEDEGEAEDVAITATVGGGNAVDYGGRMCKKCGARESIVLLLPCRHLCLCTTCGSTIHCCPVCHFSINASVHVNFS